VYLDIIKLNDNNTCILTPLQSNKVNASCYTKCVEIKTKKTIQPDWANSKVIVLIDWKKFNQHEFEHHLYERQHEGLHVLHCYL